MRTTITLDDDVRAKLEQEMRKSGESFKQTVNKLLRLGLHTRRETKPAKRFVVKPRPFDAPDGLSFNKVEELLDELDGPFRR